MTNHQDKELSGDATLADLQDELWRAYVESVVVDLRETAKLLNAGFPFQAGFEAAVEEVATRLLKEPKFATSPQLPVAVGVPEGLLQRVKSAHQRIADGHSPRRIPADITDVDLVLAEVESWIIGTWPPFWIDASATAHSAAVAAPVAQMSGDAQKTAQALLECDWSGVSIGNKAIIQRAAELLASHPSNAVQDAPTVWEPKQNEVVENCLDASLQRAASALRATGHAGDAIDASRIEYLRASTHAATVPQVVQAPSDEQQFTGSASFKNFHRALCTRFNYPHDEVMWWRDQISLEEHIANLVQPVVASPSVVPSDEPAWISKLRERLMLSPMKSNFTFTRDEVIALLTTSNAGEAVKGGEA